MSLSELEKKDYYKPLSVGKFWNTNYIEYESNGDRNKTQSTEEYLEKIRPYLINIINNLKKSDTWKVQLAIAISFIFSKDTDKEYLMHWKNENIEIMIKQIRL